MNAHDLTLTGWQVRYEQRSFWRNRRAAFFSMIFPLMYLLVVGQFLASYLVGAIKPLARTGPASAGAPLLVFAALGIAGLGFSLVGKRYPTPEAP